jgi:hypothetical protein
MKRRIIATFLAAAAPAMAQTTTPPAGVTPTPITSFPAVVQADLATVQADEAALKAAFQQLRTDESTNTAAVPADRTAVALARLQLRMDIGKLHMDAAPILQADATALKTALTQLHADQVANNAGAIAADQAAVEAAGQQARADAKALHVDGGMGRGKGWRRHED